MLWPLQGPVTHVGTHWLQLNPASAVHCDTLNEACCGPACKGAEPSGSQVIACEDSFTPLCETRLSQGRRSARCKHRCNVHMDARATNGHGERSLEARGQQTRRLGGLGLDARGGEAQVFGIELHKVRRTDWLRPGAKQLEARVEVWW